MIIEVILKKFSTYDCKKKKIQKYYLIFCVRNINATF